MTGRFTGWHMLAVLVAMFGVVIAANVVMARAAITTFGGTVVDNSYVASQRFNGWLADARRQRALGWRAEVTVDARRHVAVAARMPSGPLAGAQVSAVASHPLGRAPDVPLAFAAVGEGRFVSRAALPAGRWLIHLTVRQGARTVRFDDEVPA